MIHITSSLNARIFDWSAFSFIAAGLIWKTLDIDPRSKLPGKEPSFSQHEQQTADFALEYGKT
jgi:hypothetical protein